MRRLREVLGDAAVAVAAAVFCGPYVWMLLTSLKTRADALSRPPRLLFGPTLDNYVQLFLHKGLLQDLVNSTLIATASTLLAMLVGLPAAYAFSRFQWRGRRDLLFLLLTTRMAPAVVVALPIFVIFSRIGLTQNILGVTLVHASMGLSLVVWLMMSFIREIPVAVDEASVLDGCTLPAAFWRNVLPAIRPGLWATGLLVFLTSWNEYFFVSILTGASSRTATAAVPGLITPHGTYWGQVAALGVVTSIPVVVFGFFFRGHLARLFSFGLVRTGSDNA